jgi:hypothetical protein
MRQTPERVLQSAAEAELAGLKRDRMNAMPEGEFRAYSSPAALRAALSKRHGFDALAESSAAPV